MWNDYQAAAYCSVSFHAGNGTPVAPLQTTYGGHVTSPSSPTRDGYEFSGWYTDNTYSTRFDFSAPLVSDESVYAKWAPAAVPQNSSSQASLALTGINSQSREFDQWLAMLSLLSIIAGFIFVLRRRSPGS
jgi:uncharacterized repeat protein (TIGR02543 family)